MAIEMKHVHPWPKEVRETGEGIYFIYADGTKEFHSWQELRNEEKRLKKETQV